MVAARATRLAIYSSFAKEGNLSDLYAKGEAISTVFNVLGLGAGIQLVSTVCSSMQGKVQSFISWKHTEMLFLFNVVQPVTYSSFLPTCFFQTFFMSIYFKLTDIDCLHGKFGLLIYICNKKISRHLFEGCNWFVMNWIYRVMLGDLTLVMDMVVMVVVHHQAQLNLLLPYSYLN